MCLWEACWPVTDCTMIKVVLRSSSVSFFLLDKDFLISVYLKRKMTKRSTHSQSSSGWILCRQHSQEPKSTEIPAEKLQFSELFTILILWGKRQIHPPYGLLSLHSPLWRVLRGWKRTPRWINLERAAFIWGRWFAVVCWVESQKRSGWKRPLRSFKSSEASKASSSLLSHTSDQDCPFADLLQCIPCPGRKTRKVLRRILAGHRVSGESRDWQKCPWQK